MKGMVFRAFESFVEQRWPDKLADDMMSLHTLPSGGAYTTVGNYAHSEFLTMAVYIAEKTKTPIKSLVTDFGEVLFHRLATAHTQMVKSYKNPIELLAVIENVIHRDVRKLYDNTELPRFDVKEHTPEISIELEYTSARPFADLAHGLIWGCLDFYGVKEISSVTRHDVMQDGTRSVFKVKVGNDVKRGTD